MATRKKTSSEETKVKTKSSEPAKTIGWPKTYLPSKPEDTKVQESSEKPVKTTSRRRRKTSSSSEPAVVETQTSVVEPVTIEAQASVSEPVIIDELSEETKAQESSEKPAKTTTRRKKKTPSISEPAVVETQTSVIEPVTIEAQASASEPVIIDELSEETKVKESSEKSVKTSVSKLVTSKKSISYVADVEYHGFKLGRTNSNDATVIEYKAADGTTKAIAVADAAYRHVKQFGTDDITVPELETFPLWNVNDNRWINGSEYISNLSPMPESVTNDLIYNLWSSVFKTDKSAKENCDVWMKYNNQTDSKGTKGVPAVAWCRSQTIGGQPCDLPNIYETMVIWACGDQLDLMDPTAEENPTLKLGYTTRLQGIRYSRCQLRDKRVTNWLWSSTAFRDNGVLYVNSDGRCGFYFKNSFGTAVPILEL